MATTDVTTASTTRVTIAAADVLSVSSTGSIITSNGTNIVTWSLAAASTTAATITNAGAIQNTGGRGLTTSGTATVAQTLNVTNTGSFLGSVDAMQIGGGLAGGTFAVDNSGTMTGTSGKGINVQEYGNLGSYSLFNRTGATITGTTDALRVGTKLSTPLTFAGTITIDNSGTIKAIGTGSSNGQAIDLGDLVSSTGTVTITNRSTGLLQSADSDAVTAAAGTTIYNYGTIEAKLAAGSTSKNNGIDFKGNAGGSITNFVNATITGAHHGITNSVAAGQTYAPALLIRNDGTINGQLGSGINLDTAPGTVTTIDNDANGTIVGHAGGSTDGDGIDVDGLVVITNSGLIEALGTATSFVAPDTAPPTSEAIAVGGGTITNDAGATIHSVQRAITVDDSSGGNAFGKTTITNHGTITGDGGQAIRIVSTTADVIANAGTINGSVTTGNGNVTLNNAGTINGAVTTGNGDDVLTDTGTITGAIATGLGNDRLTLGSVHVGAVDLGGGTDAVVVTAGSHAVLDGAVVGVETVTLSANATLELASTLGGSGIVFSDASAQALVVGNGALAAGDLADVLTGLGIGDTIAVAGIGTATQATLGADNLLTVSGGTATATFHLAAGEDHSGQRFHVASDGAGGTVVSVVANSAAVAASATVDGTEDTGLQGTVSATDADNDNLTFALGTGPAHGVLTFHADGTYAYTPDDNYFGADSFTFTANDGTHDSAAATITLALDAVNDNPALTGSKATLARGSEDIAYTVTKASLLTGFSDADGETLSVSNLSASHGTVTDNGDGTFTITNDADFNGPVSLSYIVTDGAGGQVNGRLGFSIAAVNDAPELTGVQASLAHATGGTAYVLSASDLLAGFADADGDALAVAGLAATSSSVIDNLDGTFTIIPAPGFAGAIALTYAVIDGKGGSTPTSQALLVDAPANVAPVLTGAKAVLAHGTEDTAYTVSVASLLAGFSDANGDAMMVASLAVPGGSAVDNLDGTYTVMPGANVNGPVTLSYTVSDGKGGLTGASTSFIVDATNDAPVLSGPKTALPRATGGTDYILTSAALTAGFTDVDGDTLSVTGLAASAGTVAVNADGTFTLTTARSFGGTITLSYTVIDGHGGTIGASNRVSVDSAAVYIGTAKANVFVAPTDADWTVSGQGGIDTLTTRNGNDIIDGGLGNDRISAGGGDDLILVGAKGGTDKVDGGAGNDTLKATAANAVFLASAITNIETISGNGFKNVVLNGTTQNDVLDFSAIALDGIDAIHGLNGADTISGSASNDQIYGDRGNDVLRGGIGNDTLRGGADNDLLFGGAGTDKLIGGLGADTFVFTALSDSVIGANADRIQDFASKADHIDLSGIDANVALAGDQSFVFIGKAAFTQLGQLRLGVDQGHVVLFGNVTGDLRPDFEIIFDVRGTIVEGDMIL